MTFCNYCGEECGGGISYSHGFYKICNKCMTEIEKKELKKGEEDER